MDRSRGGHRSYIPALARWASRDPIGERGDASLYRFTENKPIASVDPTGQLCIEIWSEGWRDIHGSAKWVNGSYAYTDGLCTCYADKEKQQSKFKCCLIRPHCRWDVQTVTLSSAAHLDTIASDLPGPNRPPPGVSDAQFFEDLCSNYCGDFDAWFGNIPNPGSPAF